MYSSSDFEHLFIRYKFIRYKAEGLPEGESIQAFCLKNKVPYNLFHKWYKDTRHHIVPVQVDGRPEEEREPLPASCVPSVEPVPSSRAVRIMIDIRISNGMHIQQRNLSYERLKSLVEKLEGYVEYYRMNRFYYLRDFHDMRCKYKRRK